MAYISYTTKDLLFELFLKPQGRSESLKQFDLVHLQSILDFRGFCEIGCVLSEYKYFGGIFC